MESSPDPVTEPVLGEGQFYAQPSGIAIPNAVRHPPGLAQALRAVDLRGDGGYVVSPPSIYASGRRYWWDRRRIADLPSWMLPRPMVPTRAATFSLTGRASAYRAGALSRELEAVRGLALGHRDDRLNRAAFCLGRLVGGELAEALVLETFFARHSPSGSASRMPPPRSTPKRPASGDGRPAACAGRDLAMAAASEAEAAVTRWAWRDPAPHRRRGGRSVHPAG